MIKKTKNRKNINKKTEIPLDQHVRLFRKKISFLTKVINLEK